jgi:TonB family protein
VLKDTSDAEDLRTLATGFIDLARATAPARPEAKTPEPERVVETVPPPRPEVVQPVVIRQPIPAAPAEAVRQGGPAATVHVTIGSDGRVTAATIQQSAHPVYDRLLLQAARDWVYSPALLDGRPVPSEKSVTIQLR